MSSPEQIRRQIDGVAKGRAEAERRLADARGKQAKKESEAAAYRSKAEKTSSASMARSYLRQAETAQKSALAEGSKGAAASKGIADCGKHESDLSRALSASLQKERADQERARKRQVSEGQRARKRLEDAATRARERDRAAERARSCPWPRTA